MGGSAPTTTTNYPPPIPPAGYDFARQFFAQVLPSLMGGRMPTYPRNVDPGLSQTMQTALRMGQGYAASPAPHVLGQAQGALGAYMNPQMANVGWGGGTNPQFFSLPPYPGGGAAGLGGIPGPIYPGSYNPWRFAAGPPPTYGGFGGPAQPWSPRPEAALEQEKRRGGPAKPLGPSTQPTPIKPTVTPASKWRQTGQPAADQALTRPVPVKPPIGPVPVRPRKAERPVKPAIGPVPAMFASEAPKKGPRAALSLRPTIQPAGPAPMPESPGPRPFGPHSIAPWFGANSPMPMPQPGGSGPYPTFPSPQFTNPMYTPGNPFTTYYDPLRRYSPMMWF